MQASFLILGLNCEKKRKICLHKYRNFSNMSDDMLRLEKHDYTSINLNH